MKSSNLGYPRIGEKREWKKTLESFWAGQIEETDFLAIMESIRLAHIRKQKEIGIDLIPVGDFTFYDHMLDTAVMFGLVPERFHHTGGEVPLSVYFSMARGSKDAPACEMTKWFNTNYHYIAPELNSRLRPRLIENKPLKAFQEAKAKLGIKGKPVLIGPYTFIKLSKGFDSKQLPALILLLLPLYEQVLQELEKEGAEWVQIDEPILVTSLAKEEMATIAFIYQKLNKAAPRLNIMLQTYFEAAEWYEELIELPVQGIGLDFTCSLEENSENILKFGFPSDKILAAGMIDGRNIWRADLAEKRKLIETIAAVVPEDRLWLQPSSSLIHLPITIKNEINLSPLLKHSLAFADEKLEEIVYLAKLFRGEIDQEDRYYQDNQQALRLLKNDASRYNHHVQKEQEKLKNERAERKSPYLVRKKRQKEVWELPILPTTTIGSFSQTAEVRKARQKLKKGEWIQPQYEQFIQQEIRKWIAIQEEIGLDVLVHGEFERTDMVEFFGEKLGGFAFTENGWVQSYGSRCFRPPIIYGDVEFLQPMTVKESVYAQSLTSKPVKGMLTGPVTILNWSFVRDDRPRQEVAEQIALALRKEVEILEAAGISMIQVDEPALLEGLPLKEEKKQEYLEWAVRMFRIVTSTVEDTTQIHTHMCYCDFSAYMHDISKMDADVISIETSRSHGEIIPVFEKETYDKGIGLGVYDIHSPRVPSVEEIAAIIEQSLQVLDVEQFWINPDCGLKTRGEEETIASLKNMVAAARLVRKRLDGKEPTVAEGRERNDSTKARK
ncbi:methionine synthase (B12-independent) [Thermolongibacillus altinsuensis]|uniref:5-methyltetrahydropteroyltriglutamate--homocysteine methyltransferase n=1 Tax=Thermolongibacillus altinsuensis TaxID=575256 RepID=A0A4R1QCV8_9BACL|nr:5-methyltetrahydropteroyltriglutamate--homocysteine S-methyltransferase [Thermolongibacillus altinsuensis]TCL44905.1 methionine synthase (B12-independent) [Thermolongibacillus altinsuensis]